MSTVTVTATKPSSSAAVAPAPSPSSTPNPVVLLIDGRWYDVSAWKHQHPGGALILEQMSGGDATDAFYSLHSEEAIARLKRMHSTTALPASLAQCPPPEPSKQTLAFRKFRQQLAEDGWFRRNLLWEAFYTLSVYVLLALGTVLAWNGHPWWAILSIGFGMQQSGWIAHDYIHARNKYCYYNGLFLGSLTNGFSRGWWSNKHNTHHVFTNYIGVDADIQNDPVFHLFFPEEDNDVFFRKMQHWYFVPVASVLYFSWRMQSFQWEWEHRNWKGLALIAVNYLWLSTLGWGVALGSIYLGGFLVATIVTATHQSEEMIDGSAIGGSPASQGSNTNYEFCSGQFATTRDARTSDFFMEWVWGGMQYQLEHHLFPTMPKYYYAAVTRRVEQFAKEHGLDYRCDTQWQIWRRNFNTLKYFAQPAPTTQQQKKVQ